MFWIIRKLKKDYLTKKLSLAIGSTKSVSTCISANCELVLFFKSKNVWISSVIV